MNVEIFVQNVEKLCKIRGINVTDACRNSGAGKDLINQIKRGSMPSIQKIESLAAYLGVNTSELLGENKMPIFLSEDGLDEKDGRLLTWFRSLPAEKQKAILIAQDAPEELVSDLDH